MIAIGIDPGVSGAVAFVGEHSCVVEDIPTMPLPGNGVVTRKVDSRALLELLRRHAPAGEAVQVFCEQVGNVGGKENRTMAQGSLMRTLGAIEAVFECMRMPPHMVAPQTWKRFYGLGSNKAAALHTARELYPAIAGTELRLAKHHNRAESVLIAHWGRRNYA